MTAERDTSNATYLKVARAIRYLREHAAAQPSLDDVAAYAGLSPHHFQRVFSAWAGISPKRFLQVLTAERAKQLLASSRDVLTASIEAGLSGPGRLHDLTVACDAMTPGELAQKGAGLTIRAGVSDSPYGLVAVGVTERGVCHLQFVTGPPERASARSTLSRSFPRATVIEDDASAGDIVTRMFARARKPVPVLLAGTNFQVQVWRALVNVPAGHLVSYGTLAHALGRPTSQRAVAGAVAANDIALLIPCHRVIRESGALGGYRWGAARKDVILARELAG